MHHSAVTSVFAGHCSDTSSTRYTRVPMFISRSEAVSHSLLEKDRKLSAVRGVAHLLQLQCLVPTAIIFNHSLPSAALDPRVPQPSGLFRRLFLLLPKSPLCMRKQGKSSLSLALAFSWPRILQVSQLPNPSCSLHTPRFGLITNRESSACGAHKSIIACSLCPITDPVAFLLPSHEISNQRLSLIDQLLCIAQTLGLQKSRRLNHH